MGLIPKTAQICHFLYLQGLIAQQIFGLLQPGMEEVVFGRGGKKAAVIDVKLAFLQIDNLAEAFYIPVFLTFCEHLQAQVLKQGVEMADVLLLHGLLCHAPADGEEQQGDQSMDEFLTEREA